MYGFGTETKGLIMNSLQRGITHEWFEGIRKDDSPKGKRRLKKTLAQKYDLTMAMIEGIVKFAAVEGMERIKTQSNRYYKDGHNWQPIDYVELIGDLEQRVGNLERRLEYLVEGVERVLEDGQTFAIHLQQLHAIGKNLGIRKAIRANKTPLIELTK